MIGMLRMTATVRELARYAAARTNLNDRGATAVEYGMIVALIAAVIVATVVLVGEDVLGGFEDIEDEIDGSQN